MPLSELDEASRHRRIAGDFTVYARQVSDWEAPAPVDGWTARDVVDHLITWLPEFLTAGGITLPTGPSAAAEPVAAWQAHAEATQQILDDPDQASRTLTQDEIGSMPVSLAIDQYYTIDIFMHTWDLARASGQVVALEPQYCRNLLAGMQSFAEAMRASGEYGPAVAVPADADPQTQLMAFVGRDPAWRPAP